MKYIVLYCLVLKFWFLLTLSINQYSSNEIRSVLPLKMLYFLSFTWERLLDVMSDMICCSLSWFVWEKRVSTCMIMSLLLWKCNVSQMQFVSLLYTELWYELPFNSCMHGVYHWFSVDVACFWVSSGSSRLWCWQSWDRIMSRPIK